LLYKTKHKIIDAGVVHTLYGNVQEFFINQSINSTSKSVVFLFFVCQVVEKEVVSKKKRYCFIVAFLQTC